MKLKLDLNGLDQRCIDAIHAALNSVNGRATSFAITSADTVLSEADRFEKSVRMLPLRDRAGAVCTYTPAGPSAKAYRHAPRSTTLTFKIAPGGTVLLIGVDATTVYPKQPERRRIAIRPSAHARYVEARARDFAVIAKAA